MIYKEFLPASALRDKVECYWKFVIPPAASGDNQPIPHIVLPHGCAELVFIKNPVLQQNFIVFKGVSTSKFSISIFPGTTYAGIRLKPGQSKWLSDIDIRASLNQHQPYPESQWHPWQRQLMQQLAPEINIEECFNDSLLNWEGESGYLPDQRIIRVADRIISDHGTTDSATLADLAFLSLRQLQRVFKNETGMSIKQFSQIRKLRHAILQLYLKQQHQQEIIVDYDYTDSSHFYKSFRNITQHKLEDFFKHLDQIDHQQIV